MAQVVPGLRGQDHRDGRAGQRAREKTGQEFAVVGSLFGALEMCIRDSGKAVAGQSAVELDESSSYLDAILGTYDVAAASTYVVSGEGIVCVARKYTNNTYDNRVTGALTTSVASSSVSGLTSESLQNMRAKHLVAGFPQGRSR